MTDSADLAAELMRRAVCHTDHPADAASALMLAAGEILHAKFGVADTIEILRAIIDDTAAAMVLRHGRRADEPMQ